jgi:RNA polymerase sigma-70 factor (ECF subfamily)
VPHEQTLTLYTAHRRRLMDYATGIVGDPCRAEDVVQEAFLRFRSAASGRTLDEPVGFLYRIVRNLSLDYRRRANLEGQYISMDVEALAADMADDQPSPEQQATGREELRRVMEAIAELPERTRIALEMHRFGGCTLKEIADRLAVSVSMAQVLVIEGVRHCQRCL